MRPTLLKNATLYRGGIGEVERGMDVVLRNGLIAEIAPTDTSPVLPGTEVVDLDLAPLVPGYVDIHCHGAQAAAFDDGAAAVPKILEAHQRHGTAFQCLSLVTDDVASMARLIRELAPEVKRNKRALGIHPEGPFLSPKYKGAHPEDLLRDPFAHEVAELVDASSGTLSQLTLAPEREGGIAAIEYLQERGVTVSLGHSDADYEQAQHAFDAGASILTHAFNGMRGIHHRAPGPVIAALGDDRVWLEVINDGVHVHPAVVRSLFQQAPERMVLITDAMSAACSPDGDYTLGTLDVVVSGGVARLKEGASLAGSTLTMDRAVAGAVRACGVSLDTAVAAATQHPAAAVGAQNIAGEIAIGRSADVLALDPETLLPSRIYLDGELIK